MLSGYQPLPYTDGSVLPYFYFFVVDRLNKTDTIFI